MADKSAMKEKLLQDPVAAGGDVNTADADVEAGGADSAGDKETVDWRIQLYGKISSGEKLWVVTQGDDSKVPPLEVLVAGFTVEGRNELNFFFLHWMMVLLLIFTVTIALENQIGIGWTAVVWCNLYVGYELLSLVGCCASLEFVEWLVKLCCACFWPLAHSCEETRLGLKKKREQKKEAAATATGAASMA